MGCTPFHLQLPFAASPALVERVRLEVSTRGGNFTGDERSGALTMPTPVGSMSGNYNISGRTITVVVTDKPMLVTCGRIESEMRSLLAHIPQDIVDTYGETTREVVQPRTTTATTATAPPHRIETDVTFVDFEDTPIYVDRRPPSLWPLVVLGVLGASAIAARRLQWL